MRHLGIMLIFTIMVILNSASSTLADCPTCGGQEDWTSSANAFLEGRPINDNPSDLSGPQRARLLDAQIDAKKKASQTSKSANNQLVTPNPTLTPMLDVKLTELNATPNPANSSEMVEIVAVFENANSSLKTSNEPIQVPDLTVNANIKNSAGLNVGSINLKPSSGNAYSGIWRVGVGSGTYNATIDASGPDGSKSFKDALQIVIKGPKKSTSTVKAIRNLG